MTVLHLQLDVDSEVYPELHQLLSSIGSGASREERLRQLAATGLLWERLRVQALAQLPLPVPDLALGEVPAATVPDPATSTLQTLQLHGVDAPDVFVREMQSAVDALPVLTEVVDPSEFGQLAPAQDDLAAPPPYPASASARRKAAASLPAGPTTRSHPAEALDSRTIGLEPPRSATAGPRSRLVRMKEKGLFRNE